MTSDDDLLAALADALIPAEGVMPSASQAGVPGPGLEAVLRSRPDLADPLAAVLRSARDQDAATFVVRLRTDDPPSFAVLSTAVAGGYLQDRRVQELLGYSGREAAPLDEPDATEDFERELLAPVRAAGRRYRPTP